MAIPIIQVWSQDPSHSKRFNIGLSVALQFSGMNVDYESSLALVTNIDYPWRSGYSIGIPLAFNFKKRYSLQSGLTFINNNTQAISEISQGAELQHNLNFKWVGIPLILNYDVSHSPKSNLFLGAGFYLTRLLSSKNEIVFTDHSTTTRNEFNIYDQINPINGLASLQIGGDFFKESVPIRIIISFDKTLFDMSKEIEPDNSVFDIGAVQSKMKLYSLSFGVTYFFKQF